MIRVSLRNMTGEPLDFFDATDEENAASVLAAKLASGDWSLSGGDTITVEDGE
jgi:hypothetical protein